MICLEQIFLLMKTPEAVWLTVWTVWHLQSYGLYGAHSNPGCNCASIQFLCWCPVRSQRISSFKMNRAALRSMPLPEPQTFVRARRQHTEHTLSSSETSARSLRNDDGLYVPVVLGHLQAYSVRAQYNRIVGIYVQEEYYTRGRASDSERWLPADFEWVLIMQNESPAPEPMSRQQVLSRISSEGLESPECDLLELPDQNE